MAILLDAGSGGAATHRLISKLFLKYFNNSWLETLDDAAILSTKKKLSFSADSYTVSPLFFAGGSIGDLAINGTVNDVAMLGAHPLWLSSSFIIEEGLAYETLEAVVKDMAKACEKANVKIVTGDTKVVPAGVCDKLFITTSGIGEIITENPPSGHSAKPGDAILINGTIGDHGMTVMAAREDLTFLSGIKSDTCSVANLAQELVKNFDIHVLRDPTRGGLATTLNEIATQSSVGILLEEEAIPINPLVVDGCSFLGLDPLYMANEGKAVCFLPRQNALKALAIMKKYNHEAAVIGSVFQSAKPEVILKTAIGGKRYLGMLEGAQLPRIC